MRHRSRGMVIAAYANWSSNALLGLFFPALMQVRAGRMLEAPLSQPSLCGTGLSKQEGSALDMVMERKRSEIRRSHYADSE